MCGIYGWSLSDGVLSGAQRIALSAVLGAVNDDRGGDSWGWSAGDGTVRRGTGVIVGQAIRMHAYPEMMAHTRNATTGAANEKNAHPLQCGPILGAHNGIVHNHLELNYKHGRACVVDSEHLFWHLAEGKDTSEIEAYGAVEYRREGRPGVYIAKLRSGQLSIAGIGYNKETRHAKAVIWSSDANHLECALRAVGIRKWTTYAAKESEVMLVQDGSLYETGEKIPVSAPVHRLLLGSSVYESGRSGSPGAVTYGDERFDARTADFLEEADQAGLTPTEYARLVANGYSD